MKINLKILFFLMPILFYALSALAIDISEYGDFSTRSVLMNNQKNELTQEQKDILHSKKLTLTVPCLFNQIKKHNNDNVKLLLESGLKPNESYLAEFPIYIAAYENNFEALKILYEYGAKIDRGFNSELYCAVKNKNREMAQYLLDRKANIYYRDSVTNNTILYLALKNNMLDIAKQLIDKGAPPDKKSVKIIKKKNLFYLIKDKI